MGSAMLVCQGLIEAEGFKQSRGKWGEGTRKLFLSRTACGAVSWIAKAQRLHLSLLPSSWCIFSVPPTPV